MTKSFIFREAKCLLNFDAQIPVLFLVYIYVNRLVLLIIFYSMKKADHKHLNKQLKIGFIIFQLVKST